MGSVELEGISVTPLDQIESDRGKVLHGMRKTEAGYCGFGEVYFSVVDYGVVGRWKCHEKMTMNLIVPVGIVEFVFCSGRGLNEFRTEIIGEGCYARLTVPKGIWFNFRGRKKGLNIIANVADVIHDAAELLHRGAHDIDYRWVSL